METNETKRLFFGMDVHAPWPTDLPPGRIIEDEHRHVTLVFLGNIPYKPLQNLLPEIPIPNFKVGLSGFFDECLFLPPRHPRCVAWHIKWLDMKNALSHYQKVLSGWLAQKGYPMEEREFLPHLTMARAPFNVKTWRDAFIALPCSLSHFHLYESLGSSHYKSLWKHYIKSPFEEIEHTADIAYRIHGETISQLFFNAQIALANRFPPLLNYLSDSTLKSLDEIIVQLNAIVTKVDAEQGCPFKAVSFHGDITKEIDGTLTWEMIIDV